MTAAEDDCDPGGIRRRSTELVRQGVRPSEAVRQATDEARQAAHKAEERWLRETGQV